MKTIKRAKIMRFVYYSLAVIFIIAFYNRGLTITFKTTEESFYNLCSAFVLLCAAFASVYRAGVVHKKIGRIRHHQLKASLKRGDRYVEGY